MPQNISAKSILQSLHGLLVLLDELAQLGYQQQCVEAQQVQPDAMSNFFVHLTDGRSWMKNTGRVNDRDVLAIAEPLRLCTAHGHQLGQTWI